MSNRMINLQQQQQQPQQSVQRLLHPSVGVVPAQHQQLNQGPMFAIGLSQQPGPFQAQGDLNLVAASQAALLNQQRNQISNPAVQQQPQQQQQHLPMPFMSSSVDVNLISSSRPQFAPSNIPALSTTNAMNVNACDSLNRPTPSVINAPPQFYMRQPMFDDSNNNTVSSSPRITNEPSQSLVSSDRRILDPRLENSLSASLANQQAKCINTSNGNDETSSSTAPRGSKSVTGVSSSSDSGSQERGPTISTPSSPTECGQVETIEPPPMIPIDSLEEPQATSSENDHPDDASDRLSIVDANDNLADSNSVAGTPKPSNAGSPLATGQDSNSATPSSSSQRATEQAPAANSAALDSSSSSQQEVPMMVDEAPIAQPAEPAQDRDGRNDDLNEQQEV